MAEAAILEACDGGSLCDSFVPGADNPVASSECYRRHPLAWCRTRFELLSNQQAKLLCRPGDVREASLEVEQAAIAREQRAVRDIMSIKAKGLDPFGAGPCMDFSSKALRGGVH